jgi:hypothetical protein
VTQEDTADHPGEAESASVDRLQAENEALRAELERLRAQYEAPVDPRPTAKAEGRKANPESFALVGPGPSVPDQEGPSDEAWDSLGALLCQSLEEGRPGTRWRFYREVELIPEGMTFFYAQEVLLRMWGDGPSNPNPPDPQAYRRLTPSEREQRDVVLDTELRRIDESLKRAQCLHDEGHAVASIGLLKYVDLLLARFHLARARDQAGDSAWEDGLRDSARDAEVEAWVATQLAETG